MKGMKYLGRFSKQNAKKRKPKTQKKRRHPRVDKEREKHQHMYDTIHSIQHFETAPE